MLQIILTAILALPTAIDSSGQLSRTDLYTNVPMEQAVRIQPAVVDYFDQGSACSFALIPSPALLCTFVK